MKRLYLLTLILAAAFHADAQSNNGGQAFTLEQCISYALENSINIKNAALDERIAKARVKETRGIGLPQINASASAQHNRDLPRFFGEKQTVYGFAGKDANGDPIPYDQFLPGLADDDVIAGQNFFQLQNAGNANIGLTQILFNGSYLVGLQAANAYRDLAVKQSNQTKEQIVQQVSKAYYGVLINKDRLSLFESNISRVESLLKTTQAMNENGFVEAIDVDRLKVTLNNLNAEKSKFANLQILSLHLLKFQMGYPMNENLEVTGDIASLSVDENVLQSYTADFDYGKRSDFQLLQANQRLQSLNLKNKHAASLPSLVAFANYGWATQSGTFGGLFKTETNLGEVVGVGPDKWYPVSSLGLSLSVPIFSGLQRTYQIQQAKLELLKVENNFTALKSGIDMEVKQSAIAYLNAITSLKSQNENRQLAENVARVTRIKYEEGVGSNLEVVEAESSLREAQINYYSALYDALVAKVDLDKAYGKLSPSTTTSTNK